MTSGIPLVTRGAVVYCKFPLAENPDLPGPTFRPCLILRTFRDIDTGEWMCILAYGTSRTTRANIGLEIKVSEPDELVRAGLDKPTRFTLSRMRILPLRRPFLFYYKNRSPVAGYIDTDKLRRIDDLCETLATRSGALRPLIDGRECSYDPVRRREASAEASDVPFDVGRTDEIFRRHFTGRPPAVPGQGGRPRARLLRRR